MAATVAGRRLTEAHRLTQLRLAALTVADLRAVWPLLDPENLDGTLARWLRAAVPLVGAQHRNSSTLAAGYTQAFRKAEAPDAPTLVPPAAPALNVERVVTSLTVTGPISVKEAVGRGVPLVRAMSTAEAQAAAAALRHALTGGRDTVARHIDRDPAARGWRRVTSGDPCQFCSMLASRGAVYGDATGAFQAHDSCSCQTEPVYR